MGRIKSTPAPTGDEKKRLLLHQHLSSFSSFFSVYIFSLFPSFLPSPFKRLLSVQHMSFSKEETIISLQSQGERWISLFCREHERLKWSQYADIGLNSGYGSALQSLCICDSAWTRLYVLHVLSSTVFYPCCSNRGILDGMLQLVLRYCTGEIEHDTVF